MEVSSQLYALAVSLPGQGYLVCIAYIPGWASEAIWMFWKREISHASAGN